AEGRAAQVGPTADIYSLGAILYELLASRPPYQGKGSDVLAELRRGPPAPPEQGRPGVPRALSAICRKAMARSPPDRYPGAAERARDVERWLADEPVTAHRETAVERLARGARRHRAITAGAAALLLTAVVALIVNNILVKQEQARTEEAAEEAKANEKL